MLAKNKSASPARRKTEKTPAYKDLAQFIKEKISSGEYPPGTRVPSEDKMCQMSGRSLMTVRQAVNLLVQDGLLERIQGSGTYVASQVWTQASFSWNDLGRLLADRRNISLSIYRASLLPPGPRTAEHMKILPHEQVIYFDRLVSYKDKPLLLNHSVLKFDPCQPVVEAELEMIALNNFATGLPQKFFKKSQFSLSPATLSSAEAKKLALTEGESCLKISYTLFDYQDSISGSGWFLVPKKWASLSSSLGVWLT
ncbi:MAG: GntR family transcriptional regulator [Deltaproteobacteria bacterium]|jgi:DNA-binding GntR family transcriptional regulator|nr:GntR family transcriptional regulator [Deltaproteobacteria bacterium]